MRDLDRRSGGGGEQGANGTNAAARSRLRAVRARFIVLSS